MDLNDTPPKVNRPTVHLTLNLTKIEGSGRIRGMKRVGGGRIRGEKRERKNKIQQVE